MRAGEPVQRRVWEAITRPHVVDAFEDKIVAEDEPKTRSIGTARGSIVNRCHRDIHFDFRGRGDLNLDLHAWHFSFDGNFGLSVSTASLPTQ